MSSTEKNRNIFEKKKLKVHWMKIVCTIKIKKLINIFSRMQVIRIINKYIPNMNKKNIVNKIKEKIK